MNNGSARCEIKRSRARSSFWYIKSRFSSRAYGIEAEFGKDERILENVHRISYHQMTKGNAGKNIGRKYFLKREETQIAYVRTEWAKFSCASKLWLLRTLAKQGFWANGDPRKDPKLGHSLYKIVLKRDWSLLNDEPALEFRWIWNSNQVRRCFRRQMMRSGVRSAKMTSWLKLSATKFQVEKLD